MERVCMVFEAAWWDECIEYLRLRNGTGVYNI